MRKTKSRERIRILSLVVVLLLLPTMMFAIPESGKKVTLNLESVTVKDFFDALRQQTGLSFVYNTEQTKSLKPITIHVKDETVDNVLRTVLNMVHRPLQQHSRPSTKTEKKLRSVSKDDTIRLSFRVQ